MSKKKTSEKRSKEANLKRGNPEYQFTSENQPSPEAKSAGKRRAKTLKELLAVSVKGNDKSSKVVRGMIATYLGCDPDEVSDDMTLEIAMHLRQIDKAIKKGDTQAYNSVMDRAHGKAIAKTEVTGAVTIDDKMKIVSFLPVDPEDEGDEPDE